MGMVDGLIEGTYAKVHQKERSRTERSGSLG